MPYVTFLFYFLTQDNKNTDNLVKLLETQSELHIVSVHADILIKFIILDVLNSFSG